MSTDEEEMNLEEVVLPEEDTEEDPLLDEFGDPIPRKPRDEFGLDDENF